MKKLFTFLIGIILFVTANAQAPQLNWAKSFNGKSASTDSTSVMKMYILDKSIYIAGTSDAYGTANDIVLIKRDFATGDTLWTRHYNGPTNGDDQAVDMVIDQTTGDVYVTGKSMGISTGYDVVTLKYSPNGTLGWAKRWDNEDYHGDDIPKSIGIDFNSNIYVSGSTFGGNTYLEDCLVFGYTKTGTLKYTNAFHNISYSRGTYEYSNDYVFAAKVNNLGQVFYAGEYLLGVSESGFGMVFVNCLVPSTSYTINGGVYMYHFDPLYNQSCIGTWPAIFVENGYKSFPLSTIAYNDYNYFNAMDLDNSNNVYLAYLNDTIVGTGTGYTISISKVNNTGCTVWEKKYGSNPSYKNLRVNSIKADSNGNVYMAGFEKNSSGNLDWFVIKYNSSGVFQWRKTKKGTGSGNNIPNDIAFDNLQNPVVVGVTNNIGTNNDITFVKYNKTNGAELFSLNYDSGNGDEKAYNIIVDASQKIIINGIVNTASQSQNMITLRYCNPPVVAGVITGTSSICQGQNSVTYTVPEIENATSYLWTLPTGATGTSTTNSISVNYSTTAISGNITVKGHNDCADGSSSTLPVVVNQTPATPTVTLKLDVNELQSDANNGNQWYNKDGLIIGATTPKYTPKSSGEYYVVVSVNGCTSNASNTKYYIVTGIDPIEFTKSMKVYPNPVTNELIIEIEGNSNKTNFEVLNSAGQVVFSGNLIEKTIVQTTSFAPGVYLIKLESGKSFEFKKIIKN